MEETPTATRRLLTPAHSVFDPDLSGVFSVLKMELQASESRTAAAGCVHSAQSTAGPSHPPNTTTDGDRSEEATAAEDRAERRATAGRWSLSRETDQVSLWSIQLLICSPDPVHALVPLVHAAAPEDHSQVEPVATRETLPSELFRIKASQERSYICRKSAAIRCNQTYC
ncbi:hypothetical protein VZT92_022673 [Zoarces viviparus]|uniref:Uncharacterized protein n=1 Tax=Zoarces viviparus TaxID=48416 RepID=A0AAW1EEB3_ZOAVI